MQDSKETVQTVPILMSARSQLMTVIPMLHAQIHTAISCVPVTQVTRVMASTVPMSMNVSVPCHVTRMPTALIPMALTLVLVILAFLVTDSTVPISMSVLQTMVVVMQTRLVLIIQAPLTVLV